MNRLIRFPNVREIEFAVTALVAIGVASATILSLFNGVSAA